MKIETFIKKEAKKYRQKVIRNKEKGVNLDYLQREFRKHKDACDEFIRNYKDKHGFDLTYQNLCKYKKMAEEALQDVDNEIFGVFKDGKCIGYDFYR